MTETTALPWTDPRDGLPLLRPTPEAWLAGARADLNALLVDHAHCELKAASAALSLIGRCADDAELVRSMLALSHEEMRHFRQVLDVLEARGGALTPPRPDRYVARLRDWSFREPGGLGSRVDRLLVCAFVEARSCERFRILAAGLAGDAGAGTLGTFYLRLADAESRHWETFRDLAIAHGPRDAVTRRLEAMAGAEAGIVGELPLGPRMH